MRYVEELRNENELFVGWEERSESQRGNVGFRDKAALPNLRFLAFFDGGFI